MSHTKSNIGSENNDGLNNTQYAFLDTAFINSTSMEPYETKMKNNDLLLSPQSEQKIDSCVDSLFHAYDRTSDVLNQTEDHNKHRYLNPHDSETQNGVVIPLTRSQKYANHQHGSELLEGFNNFGPQTNWWKWILIIILLAIIIYAVYIWYKNKNSDSFTYSSDSFNKALNNLFNK